MVSSTLPNGMRLLIDPRGEADAVALYLWINVGSVDEPPGLEGAAHVVEHMVFKGTRSFGVGELSEAVESVGGDLNAWTSFEETVFHATVPARGVDTGLRVLAEMLREGRFDAGELERERLVILEEIRGGEDDPGLVLSEATWAAAFPGHPYGRSIIGTMASVGAVSREALVGFYEQHYAAANACLAVAGPVDAEAIAARVAELFGGGRAAPARAARTATPAGAAYRALRRGFETPMVQLAWAGPGLGHPDLPAVDVLCAALGGGASSPLEARLRLSSGLCTEVGLHHEAEADAGLTGLFFHPREGGAREALVGARDEVARARAGGIPAVEVERARAQILADRVFGRQTVDGRAHAMTFYRERYGDAQAWRAYDAAILAVDAEAVTRAAREWLAPEREVGVALLPAGLSLKLDPPKREPRGVPARPTGVERLDLPNGVRLLLHPDDGEVAAITAVGFGGGLRDGPGTAGHGVAWARALMRGAGHLGPIDFPAAVERLAGGLSAVSGRSSQLVRAEFVASSFLAGLPLFFDALLAPRFEDGEVAAVRGELLDALDERDDHPEARLSERVWALSLGRHPWSHPAGGTRRSLGAVTPRALARRHGEWLRAPGLVVAVAGAFDPDRVRRMVQSAVARVGGGALPLPTVPAIAGPTARGGARAGREQAHLAMAWAGVAYTDRRQPALEVLVNVLGGQAGRLFRELREERGLAYDVSAATYDGLLPGLVVTALATEPGRLAEAEAAMAAAVARVHAEGVAPEEVERARQYLLGSIAHELQTASARAQALAYAELYGLGAHDYAGAARRRIEAVTEAQVRAVARELLGPPRAVARVLPRSAA